jgi:hypothetical protein
MRKKTILILMILGFSIFVFGQTIKCKFIYKGKQEMPIKNNSFLMYSKASPDTIFRNNGDSIILKPLKGDDTFNVMFIDNRKYSYYFEKINIGLDQNYDFVISCNRRKKWGKFQYSLIIMPKSFGEGRVQNVSINDRKNYNRLLKTMKPKFHIK